MSDALGDRMKGYEKLMQTHFMPRLPIIVRLDGKGFSKYTKEFQRPYDERLSKAMTGTTMELVKETNACIGYTQSDEITLVYYSDNPEIQVYFDGKIQKIVSVTASIATANFNVLIKEFMGKEMPLAYFDARAFQVSTLGEAANAVLWREQDATKNSISMATRVFYDHREMMNKNGSEMQDMLHAKGINWNDYPTFFKRGTYVQRKEIEANFTPEELKALPPRHHARTNPELTITRNKVMILDMPPFSKVINRKDVIFCGAEPKVASGD